MDSSEKRITLAAACGFFFGTGATVASMALPQAYPHWPTVIWQLLFWGGLSSMALSAFVGLYEIALRPRLRGKGNRVALTFMIICAAGFFASGTWFVLDRGPISAAAQSPVSATQEPTPHGFADPRVPSAIFGPAARKASQGAQAPNLSVRCDMSTVPTTLRPDKPITFLHLAGPPPPESRGNDIFVSGVLTLAVGDGPLTWPYPRRPEQMFRCAVTNYSANPVLKLKLAGRVQWRDVVPRSGGSEAGAVLKTRDIHFPALNLGPGASDYFYVFSQSPAYVDVDISDTAIAGESKVPVDLEKPQMFFGPVPA